MSLLQATKLNRTFPADQHISYLTWVAEGLLNKDQPWQSWKPRSAGEQGQLGHMYTYSYDVY